MLHGLRRASIPLYVEIADLLCRQIERGVWPPGQRLPTLEELARQYGLARVAVRQAMDVRGREGDQFMRRVHSLDDVPYARADGPGAPVLTVLYRRYCVGFEQLYAAHRRELERCAPHLGIEGTPDWAARRLLDIWLYENGSRSAARQAGACGLRAFPMQYDRPEPAGAG